MEKLLADKEALIASLEKPSPSSPAAPSSPGASGDGKATGQAVAQALKAGAPLRVEVVNQPQGGGGGKAGPGGSRGVKRPAAQAPGGGY